jgi:deoxyribose-phosphate aldolase
MIGFKASDDICIADQALVMIEAEMERNGIGLGIDMMVGQQHIPDL